MGTWDFGVLSANHNLRIYPYLTFLARQKKGFSFFSCGATPSRTVPKIQPLQVAFSLEENCLGKGGVDRDKKRKKGCTKKGGLPHGLAPSETMVWDHGLRPPLSTEKPRNKGVSGSGAPILDLVSQTPRPMGGGRPFFCWAKLTFSRFFVPREVVFALQGKRLKITRKESYHCQTTHTPLIKGAEVHPLH